MHVCGSSSEHFIYIGTKILFIIGTYCLFTIIKCESKNIILVYTSIFFCLFVNGMRYWGAASKYTLFKVVQCTIHFFLSVEYEVQLTLKCIHYKNKTHQIKKKNRYMYSEMIIINGLGARITMICEYHVDTI